LITAGALFTPCAHDWTAVLLIRLKMSFGSMKNDLIPYKKPVFDKTGLNQGVPMKLDGKLSNSPTIKYTP
jgi:hypothetical protein